ncbi:MAG: hypothetical protein GY847_36110 [Proteobacteria bacterium]|nr:hypothetical protein [Pseudomonadota bacterium]
MKRLHPKGSIELFFEELQRRGLADHKCLSKLASLEVSSQIEIVENLYEKLPAPTLDIHSDPFSFIANGHLSGTMPMLPAPYRMAGVDSLARFSCLYASQVFIHEPFKPEWIESLKTSKIPTPKKQLAESIAGQIAALLHLRPLLEAGYVRIMSNFFPPPEPPFEHVNDELQGIIARAEDALMRRYGPKVKFSVSYLPKNGLTMSIASGARDLVVFQDAVGHFSFRKLPEVKDLKKSPSDLGTIKVTKDHPWYSLMFEELLSPIIHDISFGVVSSMTLRLAYLTNREADSVALEAGNPQNVGSINKSILSELSHNLPIVQKIPIKKLLGLRKKEEESFNVYRDAIRVAIKENTANPSKGREIFQDIIRPELNKIDLAVRRNKRTLLRAVTRDVLFATGAIAIGMYSGLVTPEVGEAIAKLGGLKFLIDMAKNTNSTFDIPENIKENQYYFLWKLARRTRK